MVRCLQNSSLTSSSSIFLLILLSLAVCYLLRTNLELQQLLRQEKLNFQKSKIQFESEMSVVVAESREKDNRTQEIYNLKGVCENQLAACKKNLAEAQNTISESNVKLETFIKNNHLCGEDLKQLRYSQRFTKSSNTNHGYCRTI